VHAYLITRRIEGKGVPVPLKRTVQIFQRLVALSTHHTHSSGSGCHVVHAKMVVITAGSRCTRVNWIKASSSAARRHRKGRVAGGGLARRTHCRKGLNCTPYHRIVDANNAQGCVPFMVFRLQPTSDSTTPRDMNELRALDIDHKYLKSTSATEAKCLNFKSRLSPNKLCWYH
jgi:hypothetical protein